MMRQKPINILGMRLAGGYYTYVSDFVTDIDKATAAFDDYINMIINHEMRLVILPALMKHQSLREDRKSTVFHTVAPSICGQEDLFKLVDDVRLKVGDLGTAYLLPCLMAIEDNGLDRYPDIKGLMELLVSISCGQLAPAQNHLFSLMVKTLNPNSVTMAYSEACQTLADLGAPTTKMKSIDSLCQHHESMDIYLYCDSGIRSIFKPSLSGEPLDIVLEKSKFMPVWLQSNCKVKQKPIMDLESAIAMSIIAHNTDPQTRAVKISDWSWLHNSNPIPMAEPKYMPSLSSLILGGYFEADASSIGHLLYEKTKSRIGGALLVPEWEVRPGANPLRLRNSPIAMREWIAAQISNLEYYNTPETASLSVLDWTQEFITDMVLESIITWIEGVSVVHDTESLFETCKTLTMVRWGEMAIERLALICLSANQRYNQLAEGGSQEDLEYLVNHPPTLKELTDLPDVDLGPRPALYQFAEFHGCPLWGRIKKSSVYDLSTDLYRNISLERL